MRSAQKLERLFILRVGSNALVQPLNGLGVVIEHIWASGKNDVQSLFVSAEVRNQHFDSGSRIQSSNPFDRLSEVISSAVRKLVAIDAGNDRVFDAKPSNSLANVTRFFSIKRGWLAFAHRTESAVPCANIAQDHEGRGTVAPTLENVR